MCRSGCKTKDHANWGECARSARLAVWGPNHETYTAGDAEIEYVDRAFRDGLDPDMPTRESVDKAYKQRDLLGSISEE
jgi:hypothetical protein